MTTELDMNRLAAALKAKRGSLGLREAAQQIGHISASTLSRVENGQVPDMDTFLALCDWLATPPAEFFVRAEEVLASKNIAGSHWAVT